MMFKVGLGLTLQQSPKHPGLVSMFIQEHQVLNLTEGHHPLDPPLWASILEDIKYQEWLEFDCEMFESMRISNLIYSDLSASGASTLSIFFTLEAKEWRGAEVLA
jgi:hypothetical protein